MSDWAALYDRKSKPRIAEIHGFMNPEIYDVFERFNNILREKYNLGYVLPRYTKENGWTYTYGRSGYILIKAVIFFEESFSVDGMRIYSFDDLNKAMMYIDEIFQDGFLLRYAAYDEARTARRHQKKLSITADSNENKYKRNCKWCQKVSRNDLRRLYQGESHGLIDEDLLDNIGTMLYVRCNTAKDIYDLMQTGKIKCLKCGEILLDKGVMGTDIIGCRCGAEYTYHSYRKSFREDNMPRGAASAIFDKFVFDWEKATNSCEKMQLIDQIIHEFHVSEISGKQGRPVGVNLIQGTKKQILELILELAQ